MRLRSSSCIALGAALSVAGFVVACSSDDGGVGGVTPPLTEAGPGVDAALTDVSVPDTSSPDGAEPDVEFTALEVAAMAKLSPLPALPADPTNAFADNAAAAVLGQRLFFDKAFSGAIVVADVANGGLGAVDEVGKVACVSCHSSKATDDSRSKPGNVSIGTNYGTRNALSIVNSSFYKWTNWGGRFDSQWSLPLAVVENGTIMNGTRLRVAHLLWDKYKTDYDAIFPVPLDARLDAADANAADLPLAGKPTQAAWDGMVAADKDIVNRIFANYGKAIAAYVRLEVSRNAPFDKLVAGDKSAVSNAAKRGAKVFLGKGGCVSCHSGPNFADDQFHNIGVEQKGPHVPAADFGRFQDVPGLLASPFNTTTAFSDDVSTGKLVGLVVPVDEALRGQFRTKSLRGLANAAPYMHSGQIADLKGVVDYYATGGTSPGDAGAKDSRLVPLPFTGTDATDLVAFLESLNGDALPVTLTTDTSR